MGTLLDAYERLLARATEVPDLVLAGARPKSRRHGLDRVARAPLAGHVRHIGYIDPAKRRELYEGARLLVQPSFEEGFGLPVLEAMTVGVPVVAANRGALPEVIGDAGQLVDPEDATAMAAAIARLVDEPPFAASCAAAGVARSRQFRWTDMAAATSAMRISWRSITGPERAARHRCASA